ncbi:SGNH/GDSL hydrolase family protein [Lacipirellula parvula]|uniref:Platelet-activating factor acetylhydrolase IB gamma subunit n=1 Tax=Lacipirellula parvula TaxID=2650471 RepID=A0A5K7XA67_9BACT|nr:SGNH/GDSL hydrolase family protein [Lacipirellula parvula]BBO32797.1 platelet-activating factor acetylhydrolase IB gamma subunit [Lacipirellula parvula]
MKLLPSITAVGVLLFAISLVPDASAASPELSWQQLQTEFIAGKGWSKTVSPFDRLPAVAEKAVRPPVWKLSRDSAGMSVDFTTDADSLAVRWTLTSPQLAKPHMPATGVSGVDLYVQQGERWQFVATARPTKFPTNEAMLAVGLGKGEKRYRMYLPLYNGVESLGLGIPQEAAFAWDKPDARPPIVFYGTSITQGGCASRPGMAYPAILGRRLDRPVINLGFSGNGRLEPEMAELLAELDPALYVIDPLPNNFPQQAAQRLPKFLEIIRAKRPTTPILLVGGPRYADSLALAARAERVAAADRVVEKVVHDRLAKGDMQLHFVAGSDLAANGGDATVDGTHPTDLGFMLMADDLEPASKNALQPR